MWIVHISTLLGLALPMLQWSITWW